MRVQRLLDSGAADEVVRNHQDFAQRLLRIGDGTEWRQDGHNVIVRLPPSMCCEGGTLEHLVDRVYQGWDEPRTSEQWRDFVVQRAIVAPTNEAVHEVAKVALRRIRWVPAGADAPDVPTTFYIADSVVESEQRQFYPVEFLNSLNFPRVPPRAITLATGTPAVLICNLTQGLKNGTRMIIKSVTTTLRTVELCSGPMAGHTTYIPRLAITPTDAASYPFTLRRRQFPVLTAYAMTINRVTGPDDGSRWCLPAEARFLPRTALCGAFENWKPARGVGA